MTNKKKGETGGQSGMECPLLRAVYETPSFVCHQLSVITLGGTVGADDSGAPYTEETFGGSSPGSRDQYYDDGYSPYGD